ncbi:hypothetical protein KVT40_002133 [Elsinoe batatas]|uniref:alpha-glucosidase n=1 Tax=Elsinoe batatas TaxID=2601811 RepID=A0A8K0L6A9_9PEZI|nr:hypothetical protein KVT40_002133 [Elsinoe batatas]
MPQLEQVADSFVLEDHSKSSSSSGPGLAHGDKKTFETGGITASVDWTGTPIVTLGWTGLEEPLHSDLPYRSYVVDGPGIAHYTRHDRDALHVGLGEVAAPMDLTARSFKIDATDCFGYEPYKTSPMYKHMPFLVKATPQGSSWSVGAEVDGLWGFYKVYRQDYGGLDEYLIVGKTMKDIVRSYAELVGFPLLAPKWAFGYLSGGYKYTMQDDPPAHQYLLDFADKLKEHDIPFAPKVRNVFNWNKHRFPDPEDFLAKYHALGIRLLSNIKPFILASHPDFEMLKGAQGIVQTRMGADTNPACKTLEEDDYRGLEIFPPKGSSHGNTFRSAWYEDDGLSIKPDITRFEVAYSSTEEKVVVEVTVPSSDKFVPAWTEIAMILPVGDNRHLISASGAFLERIEDDASGRRRYVLPQVTRSEGVEVNGYH